MDKTFDAKEDENLVARFLNLPPSTTPEVKRIVALLKDKNEKTGFLNEMARSDGFAIWNKAIITTYNTGSRRMAANAASSNDTIIYIPLVLENGNHVNAFIFARLNDSISLKLYRANDYASYGFGTIQDSTKNAEKLAIQFMLLDFETFGHSRFKVIDDRLLKDSSIASGILTKDRKVHIEHSHTSPQNRGSGIQVWEYDVCTSTSYWQCSSNGYCCSRAGVAPGACSLCEGCWKTRTTCTIRSIIVSVDNGWYPSGVGTITGGGGGGPAGTIPTGPTPCNPNPLLNNGLLPCPLGNTTGWLPYLEPLPPTTPSDEVKNIADSSKNPFYMQKVKDLAKQENLNLAYEKSVALIDGANPNIKEESGTTAVANVQIPNLPIGQKYKSFAHTHSNTSGGTYSVFSYDDLKRMSMLLHSRQLVADKFVIFVSSYKGTHYALTIRDKTKFEKFFYYFNNNGEVSNMFEWLNSFNKAMQIREKYFQDPTDALIKETDTNNSNVLDKFLDFINEADLGTALFESNANFDSFTKVEKDESGTIKRTNCN